MIDNGQDAAKGVQLGLFGRPFRVIATGTQGVLPYYEPSILEQSLERPGVMDVDGQQNFIDE